MNCRVVHSCPPMNKNKYHQKNTMIKSLLVGRNTHPTGEKMKIFIVIFLLWHTVLFATEYNKNDQTTYGLMDCQKVEIEKYTKKMNNYFAKALEIQEDKELINMMKKAQIECSAVYQKWIDGTIRGLMGGSCSIKLIKRRTHDIWEAYLTYMDSSKSILPEPI